MIVHVYVENDNKSVTCDPLIVMKNWIKTKDQMNTCKEGDLQAVDKKYILEEFI